MSAGYLAIESLGMNGKAVLFRQFAKLLERMATAAACLGYGYASPHALGTRGPASLLRAPPSARAFPAQCLGAGICCRRPSVGIA